MKLVHIHNQDHLRIQDFKSVGWKEERRFGDLVEMSFEEGPEMAKGLNWIGKTMQTIESVLRKEITWKR